MPRHGTELTCYVFAAFFLLFQVNSVQAQEDRENETIETLAELPLEELTQVEITSVATGTEKPISEAPAVASVLTAADFQAMGATTLEEALESLPGMHVSLSGEVYQAKYLVRGIVSSRYNPDILVLINGIPMSTLATGGVLRLGILPITMVSRVEVIRGPGSALYGADAFSGVINVITKNSSEVNGTRVGGGAGTFDTRQAWLQHSAEPNDLKLTLMADYRVTEGQKGIISADAQSRLDPLFGTQASLAPGPVSLSEKGLGLFLTIEESKWRLNGSYFGKSNVGEGQGRAQSLSPETRTSLARETLDLSYREPKLGKSLELVSRVSYLHFSDQVDKYLLLFPPGANLGKGVFPNGALGSPELWERQFRFDNSLDFTGLENHRLRLGLGYFFGHIYQVKNSKNSTPDFAPLPEIVNVSDTSLSFLPENSRWSYYFYGQDEWKIGKKWEFTLGLRYDHYSDFGGTLNPRAALVWKTRQDLTMKLLYGRAFRAPTFTETYNMNNLVAIGNPNLKPEIIHVYELASTYQPKQGLRFSLGVYYFRVTDLIAFIKDPNGTTATAQNFGTQHGSGLEAESKIELTQSWALTANYSLAKTTIENNDQSGGGYPIHKIYARSDWAFAKSWIWGIQALWVGTRERDPGDPRDPLNGYATLDLILRRTDLLNHLNLSLIVRNLLDADVREPSEGPGPIARQPAIPNDLPQPGRSFFAELEYRF